MLKIKDLKGLFFATLSIRGDFVLENRQDFIDKMAALARANNQTIQIQNHTVLFFDQDGKLQAPYFTLPILPRVRDGVLVVRSRDCLFHWEIEAGILRESWVEKPKKRALTPRGWTFQNLRGDVVEVVLTDGDLHDNS